MNYRISGLDGKVRLSKHGKTKVEKIVINPMMGRPDKP